MNYLAHVYLSCGNEELMVGNFITDFCRNKDLENLPSEIMEGVELHKVIDSFTDAHPMWQKSKQTFVPTHGKYAAVLVDMVYDICLINNWSRYSGEKLADFTSAVYPILEKHKAVMPQKLLRKIDNMIADDFLMKYTTKEGLQSALEYMDRRTRFPSKFAQAAEEIENNKQSLNDEFNLFFPELIAHVEAHCEC
jgi:acyl carrier protein phosphodiesterase